LPVPCCVVSAALEDDAEAEGVALALPRLDAAAEEVGEAFALGEAEAPGVIEAPGLTAGEAMAPGEAETEAPGEA
jgi:hypothetical protein